MRVTHKMIADATGFTQSTVSKALASSGRISEETTAIIRRAANEMGYYSQNRQKLRKSENHLFPQIAILVPEITSWYYANIITKLQAQIEWLGGSVCIFITGFENNNITVHMDHVQRQNLFDGIIVLEPVPGEIVEGIPVMEMCDRFPEQEHPELYSFLMDYGIKQAVEHLTALGHQEIGFIGEKYTTSKLDEFRDTMLQLDIPLSESHIYTSAYRFERIGHDGVRAFHIRGFMPTGILCAYDEVAFGAIEELEKLGYHVPKDVSVIGINNVDYCLHFKPQLTTLQGNIDTMVEKMVEVLQAVLLEEKPCAHRYTITSTLVVRNSTAPCAPIQKIGGETI